eukprot:1943678-Ditylum_brightwellii.AAC.1
MAQEEVDLHTGLVGTTRGQVIPDKAKNNWYLMEFEWNNRGQKGDQQATIYHGKQNLGSVDGTRWKKHKAGAGVEGDTIQLGQLCEGGPHLKRRCKVLLPVNSEEVVGVPTIGECRSIEHLTLTAALNATGLVSNFPLQNWKIRQ